MVNVRLMYSNSTTWEKRLHSTSLRTRSRNLCIPLQAFKCLVLQQSKTHSHMSVLDKMLVLVRKTKQKTNK